MPYDLNDEQLDAINSPSPTLVNASAGSGKTRCLVAKVQSLLDAGVDPKNILAITFTNKAANEMKERLKKSYRGNLSEMQVSTIHSMCVRVIKTFPAESGLRVPFSIYDDNEQVAIIRTLLKARKIADDPHDVLATISRAKGDQAEDQLDGYVADIYKRYQEVLKANNAVDFDDLLIYAYEILLEDRCAEYFMKQWPHVLVDEFQDTSRLQYELINSLYRKGSTKTLFLVGDYNQCVIEGTIIGTSVIDTVREGDRVYAARGNGKTGEFRVNKTIKKYVKNEPVVTIRTAKGKYLTTTYKHIHFAGYVTSIDKKYFVYLMYKRDYGYRIGFTQTTTTQRVGYPILGFKGRLNQQKGDKLWLLGIYNDCAEAKYYEHWFSIKYGIPTWMYHTRGVKGMTYNDNLAHRLFNSLDTEHRAKILFQDMGLFIDYPHHIPKPIGKNRPRNASITLCADSRKLTWHHLRIFGTNSSDEKLLNEIGFKTFPRGKTKYRLYKISRDISKFYHIVDKIREKLPIELKEIAKLADFSLPFIPASHVLPGMTCFVEEGGGITTDTIVSVKRSIFTGYIYDLDVDRVHNYVANGIATHNSIYGFRGARPDNIDKVIKSFNPTVINLTYNYRSCPDVITHANNYLQYGKAMVAKSENTGKVSCTVFRDQEDEAEKIAGALKQMGGYDQTAIIYRMNSRSLQFEKAFLRHGIPYKVAGYSFMARRVSKDMLAYLAVAANPSDMESFLRIVNVPKRGFGDAKQERFMREGVPYLQEIAKEMPAMAEFLKLLGDIKSMKPQAAVAEILSRTGYKTLLTKETDKDMVEAFYEASGAFQTLEEMILAATFMEKDTGHGVNLVTAHASKGLEWDRVFVVGVEEDVWPHKLATDLAEEERLYYVALTRAKRYLNVSCSRSKVYKGTTIGVVPSGFFRKSYRLLTGKEYVY